MHFASHLMAENLEIEYLLRSHVDLLLQIKSERAAAFASRVRMLLPFIAFRKQKLNLSCERLIIEIMQMRRQHPPPHRSVVVGGPVDGK